jgi:Uma2 family endonuclease
MSVAVTRAADDLPRRAFTVDDISRMMEAGIFDEDERFELIEGDFVMMSPQHIAHERIKNALNMALARVVPPDVFVGVESSIQLARNVLVQPDITVISQSVFNADPKTFARPRPEDILLLIEVASSSINYDRRVKARLYARHGIREFWVIDANERVTFIHTGPTGETWSSIVERAANETLTTPTLPKLSIRLSEIG